MSPARLLRAALVLLVDALALLLLSALLPGFNLDRPGAAVAAAVVVGAANAVVWPLLARLALPLSVVTLGLATLVLNGVLVVFAIDLVPGASIEDVWTGVGIALGMALLTTLLASLLAIDEDESWYRNVVRRQARRRGDRTESDVPGVIFLEIDGLAHDVLRRAMRDGNAPTLARWLRDGSHRFVRWETDWSSQTGACQAGLLHGNNDDMPAFRWWEKDRGTSIVTNHPRDAEELERRHSDGRGLLHAGGASRANILSGDATHSMLTMSTVLHRRRPIGRDYSAYFASPYAVARTFVLAMAEIASERRAQAQQRRRDVQPRIHRDRVYAAVRAWATVVQRDLQVAAIVGDMMAGRPVVYTTFLAYDEVAHHSGVERADTLAVLRHVDRQLARVHAAVADAPRPYRLVVLADHGQSQGATFLQRYGITLEELVRSACDATDVRAAAGGEDEALAYLSAGLTEVARDETPAGRAVARATRKQRADGVVALDDEAKAEYQDASQESLPELSVMASGCLGLISFPREPGRVTLERLEQMHPGLLTALREHPGIGFVHVRSERRRRGGPGRSRHPLPGRGTGRGRGPAGALRAQCRGPRPADGCLRALPRRAPEQHVLAGGGRGGRLRGARRLSRRDGRRPELPVRPLPRRARLARRGGDRSGAGAPDLPGLARGPRARRPTRSTDVDSAGLSTRTSTPGATAAT